MLEILEGGALRESTVTTIVDSNIGTTSIGNVNERERETTWLMMIGWKMKTF